MNQFYDPIENETVVELDPKWSIEELTPAAELYEGTIRFAEIITNDAPAYTAAYLVMPGFVDGAEVLTTIVESVNDPESVYG